MTEIEISLVVNGKVKRVSVPSRMMLADALRERLHLTGTHIGCEHGVCGACTVLMDEGPVRSCITLAASCDGASVTTIEGLSGNLADLLREAFVAEHALQCGFCTPGMVISAFDLISRSPEPSEADIREYLSGNLCRCTGYAGIVKAIARAAQILRCEEAAKSASATEQVEKQQG